MILREFHLAEKIHQNSSKESFDLSKKRHIWKFDELISKENGTKKRHIWKFDELISKKNGTKKRHLWKFDETISKRNGTKKDIYGNLMNQ